MKLHELSPTPGSRQRRKRVGRGDSSGMGKTACRGEKGQKSRTGSTKRPHFEGGQIPLFRRLPKRGFKSPDHINYQLVNLSVLEGNYEAGEVVDVETLREKNLLSKVDRPLKVLANGELTKALTVKADKFSASAAAKIEAAGGKAEVVE
ncbi:MAG: 50S ribosomal protein L15 [Victivallaceae bacterium]